MTTAKRKKLREKEKKSKARRKKLREKEKKSKGKRKKLKERERKSSGRVSKYSDIDEIFEQVILEEVLGKKINVKGSTAAYLAAWTKKRNPDDYYKGTKLIGKTEKEKDQHKQRIDRVRKQAADDAAKARKRNAATKGKLGK